MENDYKQNFCECKLEDGTILEYDLALEEKRKILPNFPRDWLTGFKYLGVGHIYRWNGVLQGSTEKLHFYRREK